MQWAGFTLPRLHDCCLGIERVALSAPDFRSNGYSNLYTSSCLFLATTVLYMTAAVSVTEELVLL